MIIRAFTIREAAKLSEISPQMVQYLVRHEIVRPTASGRRRRGRALRFAYGDVVVLRAVAQLLQRGLSVQRLRDAMKELRRWVSSINPETLPEACRYLVTNGSEAFFHDGKSSPLNILRRQYEFAFVLDLDPIHTHLKAKLEEVRVARAALKKASPPPGSRSRSAAGSGPRS
jgi:DNA-binding transcriptional MerR regulator